MCDLSDESLLHDLSGASWRLVLTKGQMVLLGPGQASCAVASELRSKILDIAADRASDRIRASSIVTPASAVGHMLEDWVGVRSLVAIEQENVGTKRRKRRLLPYLQRFWRGR